VSLYLDTSALIKLLVDEPGAEEARRAYSEAGGIRTTAIALVEATAALVRMHKGKRLTPTQLSLDAGAEREYYNSGSSLAINDGLLTKAAETSRSHSLRAYDAVHLAGALSFAEGEQLDFACWDKELRAAAHDHGLSLLPARL